MIDQQEWTTKNSELKVKDIEQKSSFNLRNVMHNQNLSAKFDEEKDGILLKNDLMSEENGIAGQAITINGFLEAYIENFTTSTQTYQLYNTFCWQKRKESIGFCTGRSYTIELDPNGYFQLNLNSEFSTPLNAGKYKTWYVSHVERDNSNSSFATYSKAHVSIE